MVAAASNIAIVYRARNLVNGHHYIGYTARELAKRKYEHLWAARKGSGYHFHSAIRKYGPENFEFEVLGDFDGDRDLAKLYEVEAIAKYRPEYNLSYGGEDAKLHESSRKKIGEANSRRVFTDEMRENIAAANRGSKRSPETRAKMREAQLGRKHTTETLRKMSEVQRGHPTSDEARAKMRATRKGRPSPAKGKKWSAESRLKLSAVLKGRPAHNKGSKHTEESKQKIRDALRLNPPPTTPKKIAAAKLNAIKAHAALSRPVRCLTDGRVFDSSNDADRFYGFGIGSVNRVVRGRSNSTHGMQFEYAVKE